MKRIRNILENTLYKENYRGIAEAEKNRKFCKHDLSHFLDVARIIYIYDMEDKTGLSKELIYAAALLHDIGRYRELTEGIPHHEAGAELAVTILDELGFTEEEIMIITGAIRGHRNDNYNDTYHENKLAEYLYRADKQARCCFICDAADECKWTEEKKNHCISV